MNRDLSELKFQFHKLNENKGLWVFRDAAVDNWHHVYGGGGVELDDISKHRAIVDASLRASLAADIIAKLTSIKSH